MDTEAIEKIFKVLELNDIGACLYEDGGYPCGAKETIEGQDCLTCGANKILQIIEELGYRKIQGEPPDLSDIDIHVKGRGI